MSTLSTGWREDTRHCIHHQPPQHQPRLLRGTAVNLRVEGGWISGRGEEKPFKFINPGICNDFQVVLRSRRNPPELIPSQKPGMSTMLKLGRKLSLLGLWYGGKGRKEKNEEEEKKREIRSLLLSFIDLFFFTTSQSCLYVKCVTRANIQLESSTSLVCVWVVRESPVLYAFHVALVITSPFDPFRSSTFLLLFIRRH